MDTNITDEATSPLKFEISKEDQRYIKRICNNSDINLGEKLDILTAEFNVDDEEMKEMINFLGMSLSESQFSAAKLHTLATKKRYIISSA